MAETETETLLIVFSIIVIAGVLAGRFAEKRKFPRTIPLILTGMLMIAVNSFVREPFVNLENIHEIVLLVAELALIAILFKEGMHLNLQATRTYFVSIFLIATIGTLVNTLVIGLISTVVFVPISLLVQTSVVLSIGLALLLGSIFTPTDPAATFAILKSGDTRIKEKLETILGGESAFNDVFAIILVQIVFIPLVASEGGTTNGLLSIDQILLTVIWQFLGGAFLGLVIGIFALRLIQSLQSHLEESFISLSAVALVFALGFLTNTSAAIGALVAGVVLANPTFFRQEDYFKKAMFDLWDGVSSIFEIIAFILVGSLFSILEINLAIVLFGLVLSVIVIVGRFIGIFIITAPLQLQATLKDHFNNTERIFVGFAGMKGLTTAILALMAFLALETNLETISFIVQTTIIVLVVTGLVQGIFLKSVAKKTGVLSTHDEINEILSERIIMGAKLNFLVGQFESGRITANQYRLLSIPLKESLAAIRERIVVLREQTKQNKLFSYLLLQQNEYAKLALSEARKANEIDDHYLDHALSQLEKEKKDLQARFKRD